MIERLVARPLNGKPDIEADYLNSAIHLLQESGSGKDGGAKAPHIANLFGQDEIKAALLHLIFGALADRKASRQGLIVALFGRFGQGKSATLEAVREELDRRGSNWPPVSERFSGRRRIFRVRTFNVSEYAAAEVKARFDFFLSRRMILWASLAAALLAAVLPWLILPDLFDRSKLSQTLSDLIKFAPLAGLLAWIVTAGLWPEIVEFVREIAQAFRIGGPSHALMRLGESLLKADVVMVDDFDRATPDQQMEMLWVLRRRRQFLNCVVVIAFDETPLLRERPLDAQQLLEKTFDSVLRMPPLTRRDAIEMAVVFTRRLSVLNPECNAARVLCDPLVVSDLARGLMLLGRASARFAKGFVNRLFLAVHLMNLNVSWSLASGTPPNAAGAFDVSALIRIIGLQEYYPWQEQDNEALATCLAEDDDDAIREHFDARRPDRFPDHVIESARRFICGTRHFQPEFGDWMRVLSLYTRTYGEDRNRLQIERPRALAAARKPLRSDATIFLEPFYSAFLPTGDPAQLKDQSLRNWIGWDLALLHETDQLRFDFIAARARSRIGQPVGPEFAGPVIGAASDVRGASYDPQPIEFAFWTFAVDRLRIAARPPERSLVFEVVFPSTPDLVGLPEYGDATALKGIYLARRKLPLLAATLPLSLPEVALLTAPIAIESTLSRQAPAQPGNDDFVNQTGERIDPRSFAGPFGAFKRAARRDVKTCAWPDEGLSAGYPQFRPDPSYVDAYWPNFDDDQACDNFEGLRTFANASLWKGRTGPSLPEAHRHWLREKQRTGDARRFASAILALLPEPDCSSAGALWPTDTMRDLRSLIDGSACSAEENENFQREVLNSLRDAAARGQSHGASYAALACYPVRANPVGDALLLSELDLAWLESLIELGAKPAMLSAGNLPTTISRLLNVRRHAALQSSDYEMIDRIDHKSGLWRH